MKGEIQWRRYRQSDIYYRDLDRVVALHAETEAALGKAMDLPNMMQRPVLETWLAERDGEVVGGFYLEAVVEPVFFGLDPLVTASARRFMAQVVPALKGRGFRMMRIEVPRWIGKSAESIANELEAAGFKETDSDFLHLMYDLRGGN